ncbi:MAG: SDR family NAD(P)-dependent oxidoreductase [Sedimentisphaerales bacterium]
MSWLNLEDKVAIVTGGAAGIGKACCEGLAEVGARIVVADVDGPGAEQTAASLKERFGGEHISATTDVTSKGSVEATVKATRCFR